MRKRHIFSVIVITALLVVIAAASFLSFRLIKGAHTDIGDIGGVISVHFNELYYVADTADIEQYDEGMAECCESNVMQCLIVSEFADIDRVLEEHGCTEYDRMGDKGYYKTADGKKFIGSYRMRCIPAFCTFEIEGVTIEEIVNE